MNLDFDLNNIVITEFGVGLDGDNGQRFCYMAADANVQSTLREMIIATWDLMRNLNKEPPIYNPSEKYESCEFVYLSLCDALANRIKELYEANNIPVNSSALAEPPKVFCYFVRMIDGQGRHLMALRRAAHFKGILKSRLVCLITDALKLIEDSVFKLDKDFDLLIDASRVYILRPSSFESIGGLEQAVLASVPENIKIIQSNLDFVDLTSVQDYASRHTRAARYLASIRSQKQTEKIDKVALTKLCMNTGVGIDEADGKIIVPERHILGFLEVLDRRRYEVQLIKDSSERYKATSRQKIRE